MPKELPPAHSAEAVEQIISVIRSSGLRSVHYIGGADENLLRGLIDIQPPLEVSAMDMPDRWRTGFAFFWDEVDFPKTPCPEQPEWLSGILFYQEGAPDHEIGIFDWPWHSRDQLREIVRFTGRKPPALLILIGDALSYEENVQAWFPERQEWGEKKVLHPCNFKHTSYDWEQLGEIWIGRWKSGKISYYERRKRYQSH